MIFRHLRLSLLLILGLVLFVISAGAPALADSPDFSGVDDILQGRRTLFPTDDLVLGQYIFFQNNTTTLMQTTNDNVSAQIPYVASSSDQISVSGSFATALGRVFDIPRDVVVSIFMGSTNLYDHNGSLNLNFSNTVSDRVVQNAWAKGDFTGDSFADIAFLSEDPQGPGAFLQTLTALDTSDPTQGFFYGTPVSIPDSEEYGIAAADFDGDGISEIAVATADTFTSPDTFQVQVFRPQATLNAQNLVTALTLEQVGSVPLPNCCPHALRLVAGRFSGLPTPQLVAVYNNSTPQPVVQPILVGTTQNSPQLTLTLANPLVIPQDATNWVNAKSSYLDFFESTEQVVITVQGQSETFLDVVTFDGSLNPTLASSLNMNESIGIPIELALGNFDQTITDTAPLYLEVAAMTLTKPPSCTDGGVLGVQIYHIDPSNNFAASAGNLVNLDQGCTEGENVVALSLSAGDTQERSLELGTPSKLTAQHVQPQLVLDAPPMHVDYISPGNGANAEVFNVSAVPHGFYSSYQTAVSNSAQSSHQGTTSYANAIKASVSAGVKLGDALVGSITAKVGANAGRMNSHFVAKQYGSYSSVSFDASTQTGFDDQVWFNSESHNIYIYPLLGRTACPAETPNCTPSEEQPLLLMFSGPSQQSQQSVGGSTLEWYQPVQEVGNIFSYPWNFQQLSANVDGIDLLTSSDPTSFSTDSSTHTALATWSGQSSQNTTTGNTTNISWGASASLTEKAGILGGFVGSQKFSYNGSKSVSNLNTTTTKLGQSTGIGVVKPGTFPNPPLYEYPVFPYIFGTQPPTGSVQNINLGTQIQTSGIMRSAFTADPTDPSAGSWWQGTYISPDVAVAHAARWNFQVYTPSAPLPNCIPLANNVRNNDCAQFNTPTSDIWTSEFYWMKGLLITPADANGEGPQMDSATAGDQIRLQARVYNDSFADVGANNEIVVKFYGQPWDPNTLVPLGNAFLIDTVAVPPLPGFNSISSAGTTPNWTLAGTSNFDTSSYGDQYLAFWVVVYIEDQQGNLITEMPSHGLKSIPPTLSSITDAQPYLESYSNNIGFYKSLFYVKPQSTQLTQAARNPARAGLDLDNIQVSSSRVLLGDSVVVSGVVRAKRDFDGLSLMFSDTVANTPETLFDVETISHLRANGSHLVKTVYRPSACGNHTLSIKGWQVPLKDQVQVNVTINPVAATRKLIQVIKPLNLPKGRAGGGIRPLLTQARKAFQAKDTKTGLDALHQFQDRIKAQRGNKIPTDTADTMLSMLDQVFSCVR